MSAQRAVEAVAEEVAASVTASIARAKGSNEPGDSTVPDVQCRNRDALFRDAYRKQRILRHDPDRPSK
jgi:hypothetical protein